MDIREISSPGTKEENRFHNDLMHRINPYVRFAKYDTLAPHHVIRERMLYDYELVYIKSGKVTITIESKRYDAKIGDFFLFKPGQPHSFTVHDEPLVQPHIHFDLIYQGETSIRSPISRKHTDRMSDAEKALIQEDISGMFFSDFPSYFRIQNPLYMEQLLYDVISAYQQPNLFPEIHVSGCFMRLWEYLLSEIYWQRAEHVSICKERADNIRLYLEHNADHKVTMEELSSYFHIDRSYISRIFKASYGISPIRYQLLFRLSKAKELLRYTNISIGAIAEQLGFSTQQDFCRAFQRIEGVSPSVFRMRA